MRIVDGCIAVEWLKPRTIVPVDFGEISKSSSNGEELMVFSDLDIIPSVAIFMCITDVGIESVVIAIILIDIGILVTNDKCHVEVVIG